MEKLIKIIEEIGLNYQLIIAGALGGLIGIKKDMPWYRSVISVIMGAIIATYTAPLLIELFSMDMNVLGGIGFISGYAGKHILEAIMKRITKKIENN